MENNDTVAILGYGAMFLATLYSVKIVNKIAAKKIDEAFAPLHEKYSKDANK